MAGDIDVLAALDWQYRCQWRKCRDPAVNEVHTHLIDMCSNVHYADMWGNTVTFFCEQHTSEVQRAAKNMVARLNKAPISGPAQCQSCGAPLVEMSDILRSIGPMARREEARNE